jgi:hypothetical protein
MSTNNFFPSFCSMKSAPSGSHLTETLGKNQPPEANSVFNREPELYIKQSTIKERLAIHRQNAILAQIAITKLKTISDKDFDTLNVTERHIQKEKLERLFKIIADDLQLNSLKPDNVAQLNRCARLLIKLNKPSYDTKETPEGILNTLVNESEKPAKYVALCILAPWIADTMMNINKKTSLDIKAAAGATVVIDKTNKINAQRLTWAWSGGLDLAIMSMLPHRAGHMAYANEALSQFSIGTSYMSFVLYYFRLGLHLSLLAHGTLKGSWMDPWRTQADIEQNMGIEERFRTQWQPRKFAIINDAFWATANLVCFMYLVGSNMLSYFGGGLASALMLMDVGLLFWEYLEQETDYNALLEKYNNDLAKLNLEILNFNFNKNKLRDEITKIEKQIVLLSNNTSDDITEQKKTELVHNLAQMKMADAKMTREALIAKQEELIQDKEQCEFDWKYINKNLYNNLAYSIVLALSVGIICCSMLCTPLGIIAANALILNLVGSAISCAATMAIHTKTTMTEIEKSRDLIDQNIDTDYQEKLVSYHQSAMIYKAVSDILIPAAVFSCLILAPTGLSLPILIPFVVVLFCIEAYIGQCKPQEAQLPEIELDKEFDFSSNSFKI